MLPKASIKCEILSQQALPLHGGGDELDSNYIQLRTLRGEDNLRIFDWIKTKTDKYTFVDMQNEMMKTMIFQILRKTAASF